MCSSDLFIEADGGFQDEEDVVTRSFDFPDGGRDTVRIRQRFIDRVAQFLHQIFQLVVQRSASFPGRLTTQLQDTALRTAQLPLANYARGSGSGSNRPVLSPSLSIFTPALSSMVSSRFDIGESIL